MDFSSSRLGLRALEIGGDCGHEDVVAFLRDKTTLAERASADKSSGDVHELFAAIKIGDVDAAIKLLDTRQQTKIALSLGPSTIGKMVLGLIIKKPLVKSNNIWHRPYNDLGRRALG